MSIQRHSSIRVAGLDGRIYVGEGSSMAQAVRDLATRWQAAQAPLDVERLADAGADSTALVRAMDLVRLAHQVDENASREKAAEQLAADQAEAEADEAAETRYRLTPAGEAMVRWQRAMAAIAPMLAQGSR
jgi:hypothetical protein